MQHRDTKLGAASLLALILLLAAPAAADAEEAGKVDGWGTLQTFLTVDRPAAVLSNASQVDASNTSDYALTGAGTVMAWGNNAMGGLGDGTTERSGTPVRVHIPVPVVSIGEARNSGAAIDEQDNGWVWGEQASGDLCVEPGEGVEKGKVTTPVHPASLTGVVAVQGGETHTMWLTNAGHVLSCGASPYGSLGLGEGVTQTTEPIEIPGLSHVVEMSAGERQELVRTRSGEVYAWGENQQGQTCLGTFTQSIWTPQRVELPEPARQISAGGDLPGNGSTLIVLNSGAVYGCGANRFGQADPLSGVERLRSPTNTGLNFASAVTGGEDSFGLTASGLLYSWGNARFGDLGNGVTTGTFGPGLVDADVTSVSATAKTVVDLH